MSSSNRSDFLKNLTVVLTRQKEDSYSLQKKVERLGGNAILFPTLKIIPLNHTPLVERPDIAIFVSKNAVTEFAKSYRVGFLSQSLVVAIGPATKAELQKKNIEVSLSLETDASSEKLLEQYLLKQINDKNIILFSGKGGRQLLANELKNRGAQVNKIELYKRAIADTDDAVLMPLFHKNPLQQIIVCMSCETLENLHTLLKSEDLRRWLRECHLLVISHRIQECAVALSHPVQKIINSHGASEEAILEKLIAWYAKNLEKNL